MDLDSSDAGRRRRRVRLVSTLATAIGLPWVALGIEWAAPDWIEPRWLPFALAVFGASWVGGWHGGLLATATASVIAAIWLVPSGGIAGHDAVSMVLFVATGLAFSEFAGRLRRAHRTTERALAQAEGLFEQAPDGIFVADTDGRYLAVNTAGCRLLGYSCEELVGKTNFDLIRPELADRLRQEREGMLAGGDHVSEWELSHKDGTWVPVEISAKILADGRWQGFVRDMRLRRHLETSLRATTADLERAQSVAHIGSWRLDVQRNELRWSEEAHRIFGIPVGQPLTYETFLGCVHPDDRPFVDQRWQAALRGEPYDVEHRLLVDGVVKWVREKADLSFDAEGHLLGGIGITQDVTERRNLEDELRAAEARSSGILAISADAIISIDEQQRITRFNQGAATIFGWSESEVLGRPIDILIPERLRARHREHVDRFAAGPVSARQMALRAADIRGLRKDGEEFPAAASISKLDLPGSRILTVAVRDITEQRRAEERFDLALRGADLGAWDWNVATGEVVFNARWAEMRGYRPDEVRPHVDSWTAAIHPDDRAHVEEALRRHFDGLTPEYETEHRVRTRSGQWIWILDRGKVFARGPDGLPTRMCGTELDVTERKRTAQHQQLLAEVGAAFASSLDFEETLGTITRHVAHHVADLCVVYVVEDEVRAWAAARDPVAHAWIADLFAEEPAEGALWEAARRLLVSRQSELLDAPTPAMLAWSSLSARHRRGLELLDPRSVLRVPLLAHGRVLGVMVLVSSAASGPYQPADLRAAEDLAARAALAIDNARLFRTAGEAVRVRDEVLGVVAHDLRNPLGAILNQAAVLQRRPDADPRSREAGEGIARAARRMSRLIQDLLDVNRMEAGHLSLDARPVPVGDLLREVAQAQAGLASSHSLQLRLELSDDLPEVLADRDRLIQILENLIGNAAKFSSPGGTITVGARPGDGEVSFYVSDTGPGIREEDLPRVFDRFWQAQKGATHGAGLGLPIVKGLVEAHGGWVGVESTPGRGTTFSFGIPTAAAQQLAPA